MGGLSLMITPYDLKRLEQYGNNMADYHLIIDLMPNLAKIYFLYDVEGMDRCHLSALQQAILVGIGLQCKTADSLATELGKLTNKFLTFINLILKHKNRLTNNNKHMISFNFVFRFTYGTAFGTFEYYAKEFN